MSHAKLTIYLEPPASSPSKKNKTKTAKYKVDSAQRKLIKEDSLNQKLWEEALQHTSEGHQVQSDMFEVCMQSTTGES